MFRMIIVVKFFGLQGSLLSDFNPFHWISFESATIKFFINMCEVYLVELRGKNEESVAK